ncbi:MAG: fumarylacetoacetate hydrolase family protein [Chloroherpetonaceae bacterium]|nr:fumarylacetoacetate hydrolase family protein [Chloroherpetonaceae bacterium]MDW8436541.1 fumarylacetoacetate hydrolase family protein [Chloroherpetonaceae bacterium]
MSIVQLGTERLSVGTIYCVGKNYDAHAKEMEKLLQLDATPTDVPIVFSKPAASLIQSGGTIRIPVYDGKPISSELHHEVELVLLVGDDCEAISEREAASVVAGFGVGLDMTLRDLQSVAKKGGNPWLVSKGFRSSAVLSPLVASSDLGRAQRLALELKKNGTVVQRGDTSEMIYKLEKIISYLSHIFALRRGDLIYTGTPAGVAAVKSGDVLTATLYEDGAPLTSLVASVA